MAINLARPAKNVDFHKDAAYATMLNNLQANILRSHGRDFTCNVFLRFKGGQKDVRAWVRHQIGQRVTTAKAQLDQIAARDAAKQKNQRFDGGPLALFFLSATGYSRLGLDPGKLDSKAFRKGMKDRSDFKIKILGLITVRREPNMDPPPAQWEAGFQGDIDALVVLADDDENRLDQSLGSLRTSYGNLVTELQVDRGRVLRRKLKHPTQGDYEEPIEHFGYFDGISQPLFSSAEISDYEKKFHRRLDAGEWDPGASLDLILSQDPYATGADSYGSFFVYRKLGQSFPAFRKAEADLKAAIPYAGEQAGAMLVGRFEDGTPITLHASETEDTKVDNCFTYTSDRDGFKCPVHAHIRKANPRGTTPGQSDTQERSRRIARRGIPYGRPVAELKLKDVEPGPANEPRGLLFMCYQAKIERQFEFIQRVWIDSVRFPRDGAGDDPLIGQARGAAQQWPMKRGDVASGKKAHNVEAGVTMRGGEYFFAPSVPFLRSLN